MNKPANPPALSGSRTLWAATLVLVVVVLAMGAALIRIQSRPIEPRLVWVGQHAQAPSALSVASAAVVPTSAAAPTNNERNTATAIIYKAKHATDNVAYKATEITAKPRPVLPRQPEPAVARPPESGTSDNARPAASQALPH